MTLIARPNGSAPPKALRPGGSLAWILVGAATVRLAFHLAWTPELSGDAVAYDALARGLVAGDGFVNAEGAASAWRPPLYPAFLSVFYALSGPELARWIQLGVDVGTVALTWHVARRLFGSRAAVVAGLLAALNPALAGASRRLLSESLFTFLLMAAVALTVRLVQGAGGDAEPVEGPTRQDRSSWLYGGALGLILGLATLTRGILILFPPVLVAALWWRSRRPAALAVALGVAVALTPWTVRNWVAMDAFVPVATQAGHTFYSSYFPPDGWRFGFVTRDSLTAAADTLPEARRSDYLVQLTLRRIAEEPGRLPGLTARKVLFFWVPLDWEVMPWYGALNPVYLASLLLALFWGLAAVSGRAPPLARAWPVWLPVAYVFAMALLFYGSPRFRLPVEPLLAILAGAGADARIRSAGLRRFALEMGALAVALAALALGLEPLKALARRWVAGS